MFNFSDKNCVLSKWGLKCKKKMAEIFFFKKSGYVLTNGKTFLEKKKVKSERINLLPFKTESIFKKKLSITDVSCFFIFQYAISIFLYQNNMIFLAKISKFKSKRRLKKKIKWLALNLNLLEKF